MENKICKNSNSSLINLETKSCPHFSTDKEKNMGKLINTNEQRLPEKRNRLYTVYLIGFYDISTSELKKIGIYTETNPTFREVESLQIQIIHQTQGSSYEDAILKIKAYLTNLSKDIFDVNIRNVIRTI